MDARVNGDSRSTIVPGWPRALVALLVCALGSLAWPSGAAADEIVPLPPVDLLSVMQADPAAPSSWLGFPSVQPDWSAWDWGGSAGSGTYIIAEAIIFQRDNQSANVPLVDDVLTNDTLLSAGDLNVPMAYGVRAFVGVRRPDAWGYEIGYLGIYGIGATTTLSGAENLAIAGPMASLVPLPYGAADSVQASYLSTFQSAEINLFKSCCQSGRCGRTSCESNACDDACGGCCIDWLGGFRYVNLSEQAGMTFTCCTNEPLGPFTSSYNVQTSNNLFGGQFGGRASRTWRNWAVEGWAKTGVFANVENQSQDPILDPANPATPFRTARSASGVVPAMMADLNLSAIYRINKVFGLRAGYNALWVGNVALAPEQWNFGSSADAGTQLLDHRGLFLNGVNFGIDACW